MYDVCHSNEAHESALSVCVICFMTGSYLNNKAIQSYSQY